MSVQLAQANSIRIPLADESVHCCITSPPFFGLRDYGLPPVVWGHERCWHGGEHEWGNLGPAHHRGQVEQTKWKNANGAGQAGNAGSGQFCQHCDAWRGCLGLEPTPDLYVAHLVEVFREVRRVLRGDAVVWLNLGMSYSGSWGNYAPGGIKGQQRPQTEQGKRWDRKAYGDTSFLLPTANLSNFKPKDLIPIPWLVALALQRDGWWLRSAPPWLKKNCLPESVRDRPTTAHEYWFLLSKSARYFYDAEAVRESAAEASIARISQPNFTNQTGGPKDYGKDGSGVNPNRSARQTLENFAQNPGRNRRTTDFFFESLDALIADQRRYLRHLEHVRDNGGMLLDEGGDPLALVFNTKGYSGSHYATFNPDMIEPLVKCSTSERGVCPRCGGPWERVVSKERYHAQWGGPATKDHQKGIGQSQSFIRNGQPGCTSVKVETTGWRPTCDCNAGDSVPAVVLDPFVGSGTVPMVARKLGRHGVGFDLSFDYLRDQARARLELDKLAAWEGNSQQVQAAWEELPLFAAKEAV